MTTSNKVVQNIFAINHNNNNVLSLKQNVLDIKNQTHE